MNYVFNKLLSFPVVLHILNFAFCIVYADPKSRFRQTVCSANTLSELLLHLWCLCERTTAHFWSCLTWKTIKEELVTSCLLTFIVVSNTTTLALKYFGIIMRTELRSIILSQHQRWLPDTHNESKVSVPTQQVCDCRDIALSSHSFGCPLIPCHHEPEAPLLFPLLGSPPHPCWSMYLLHILHVFTMQMLILYLHFCMCIFFKMWFNFLNQLKPKKHKKHHHRHQGPHEHRGRHGHHKHDHPKKTRKIKLDEIIQGKIRHTSSTSRLL